MHLSSSLESITESEDFFPLFVASGYDVSGLDNPLYLAEGIWMNPDGSLDVENDLDDMLEKYRERPVRETGKNLHDLDTPEYDRLAADFQETVIGSRLNDYYKDTPLEKLVAIANDLNLALVNLLDTIPSETISENVLLDAAVDAGKFAASKVSRDFAEGEDILQVRPYEVMEKIINYQGETALTLRMLGYSDRDILRDNILLAHSIFNNEADTLSFKEKIQIVEMATGLNKADLAKTAIRINLGKVNYQNLGEATIYSFEAFAR